MPQVRKEELVDKFIGRFFSPDAQVKIENKKSYLNENETKKTNLNRTAQFVNKQEEVKQI